MNEEEFLLKYNLKKTDVGVFTTLDGEYVGEFSNEDGSVRSSATKEEYEEYLGEQETVKAAGYEYDETSDYDEIDQQAQAVAKSKLNAYIENPNFESLTGLPENGSQDRNYQVAFDEIMEDRRAKGQPFFEDMEAMEQNIATTKEEEIKNNAVLSELETEEEMIEYTENQKALKEFEKNFGKDDKTKLKEFRASDMASTASGGIMFDPGEDANMLEKANYKLNKMFSDATSWVTEGFTEDGEGIEDEDAKRKYVELKDKEHDVLAPIARRKSEEFETKQKELEAQAKEVGYWSKDYMMLTKQVNQLEKKRMQLNDFVARRNFDTSVFSTKTLTDLASFGFIDVSEQLTIDLSISKKMERKEELTQAEEQYLNTQIELGETDKLPIEQSFLHEVTGGTVQSLGFLAGGMGGRTVGKGVSRYVATKLPKLATPLVKTLAVSGNLASQTVLHSGTYSQALEKYVGDVEIRQDGEGNPFFLARKDLYKTLKEENRLKVAELDKAISQNLDKPEVKAELEAAKRQVLAYDSKIKAPFSGGKSLMYGGFETLKEVASEQFGGAILGKIGAAGKGSAKWIGKKINLNPNKLTTKLAKMRTKMNISNPTMDAFNRMATAVPGQKLIGGQGEEMFEEILVQAIPTVGSNWEDYKEQLSELTSADFYAKVAAQTFLMRSATSGFVSGQQKLSTFMNLSSEQRATAKKAQEELQGTLDIIGKGTTGQQEIDKAFMNIGEGKFSIADFNNSIQGLEEQGDQLEVVAQEEMKRDFAHKQIQAVQAQGKLAEFKKAVTKAKYNSNLDAGTKQHMQFLLDEVNEMESDDATYVNSTQVISLKSKKKYTDRAIKKVQNARFDSEIDEAVALEEINKALGTEDKSIEDIYKRDLKYGLGSLKGLSKDTQEFLAMSQQEYTLTQNSKKLQKEVDRITDFKHQNVLMNEQDYSNYVAKVNAKIFGGKITADQFRKYVADTPRRDFVKKLSLEKLTKINKDIHEQLVLQETTQREFSAMKAQFEAQAKVREAELEAAKKAKEEVEEEVVPTEAVEVSETTEVQETQEFTETESVEIPENKTEAQQQEYIEVQQENIFGALESVASSSDDVEARLEESSTLRETVDTEQSAEQQTTAEEARQIEASEIERKDKKTIQNIQELGDGEFIELMPADIYLNENTTAALKAYFNDRKKWQGVAPTFQEFWLDAIESGFIAKNDLNQTQMKMLGLNWENAGNGRSNWESIWDKNYVQPNSFLAQVFAENNTPVVEDQNTEAKEQAELSSQIAQIKAEPTKGIDTNTGEPKVVTPVEGKSAVTTTKVNFKSIEYVNETTEIFTEDGKKVIKVTKRKSVDGVPTLFEGEIIDTKATLNSNPGDVWSVDIITEDDWNIPVEVISKPSWKSTYMPFSNWVKINQGDMSLEEFKKTDKFLNKVPMLYRDANGNVTGHVADSDWHNALSVQDTSKEIGDLIDLNNPTIEHQKTINEGRDTTITLRKKIANGEVKAMEVATRQGSPYIFLPGTKTEGEFDYPSRTLDQASPTSQIVFFKGGAFFDLNNERISNDKNKVIDNPEIIKKLNAENKSGNNSAYYLSPTYTENGVEHFEVIPVLRKNENNENGAFQEDIQTAKYIFGAQRMLKYDDANPKKLGITKEEALDIQAQIKAQTGLDIQDYTVAKELVHSLISMQGKNVDGTFNKFTVSAKNIPVVSVDASGNVTAKEVSFVDALFKGSAKVVQNTYISGKNAKGVSIKKGQDGKLVATVADNYEDFLKTRLSTDIVSFNIGTESNPKFTHSVQPIIELKETLAVPAPKPRIETKQEVEKTQPTEVVETVELSEDQMAQVVEAQNLLRELNALNEDSIVDNYLGDMKNISNTKKAVALVSTFPPKQQRELGAFMFSLITKNYLEADNLNNIEFKALIEREYKEHFQGKKNRLQTQLTNITQIMETNSVPGIPELVANLEDAIANTELILNNVDQIYMKKIREAGKKGFIKTNIKSVKDLEAELDKEATEIEQGYEKDYNKSSSEVIHKDKIGKKLKRIFSEVPSGETGFMGVELFENYDKIYNKIASFLCNPLPMSPNFEAMASKLDTIPEFKTIVESLRNADADVQNGFVSNMYKYTANAKFIAFTSDANKGLEGEIYFSNRNNLKQKIKETWDNNFKRSKVVDGDFIDQDKMQELADQYDSWNEEGYNQEPEVLREWLEAFGLSLSDGTWNELVAGNLTINRTGLSNEQLPFEDLFYDEGKRYDRLFSNLANYAKNMAKSSSNLDFVKNSKLIPFDDMNNIMKGLIDIESHHNASLSNITRRDGGKTVSEIVFPSHFLDSFNKLSKSAAGDKTDIKALRETAYAQNSFWLDLLENEPAMADVFSYGETGLMSMRNMDKPINDFSKIEDLSPVDYIYHQRAMFQYMKTEPFPRYKGWKMRVATMSTPTNSDKGRMMLLKTAVFDLLGMENTFSFKEGEVAFSEELQTLVFDQLILPELNRIVEHKKREVEPDMKNYNKGAVRFNLMPGLNTIEIDGVPAIKFLEDGGSVKEFTTKYKALAVAEVKSLIDSDVQQTLNILGDTGDTDLLNKSDYVERNTASVAEKKILAEYDYVINSMISNQNIMQTIAGDPALYYNSKGASSTINDVNEQDKYSRDLGTNMGKRLAMMIAPGIVIANADSHQHIQLFLQDQSEVAENAEKIIGWHYGNSALQEKFQEKTYAQHIQDLREKKASKAVVNQLNARFSKVADFFDIESTDAQEYTTLKEHLRLLVGEGKITQKKADYIYNQVHVLKKPLDKNDKDVQMVLQPMKPVYTGSKIQDGVNRMMYIKSSSFPLIPDLVAGTALEPLMNKMNEIEERSGGKTVRASYQSANKVGAMNSTVNPFKQEDLDNLTQGSNWNEETGSPTNSMVLESVHLKIQQDVPFKSAVKGDDKVSMGTQIFKLLFGDGVAQLKTDDFDGPALQQEFFQVFSTMMDISRDNLLDKLGLDENFNARDKADTFEKLSDLLRESAEERDFSDNDMRLLESQQTTMRDGSKVDHFNLPLWFSGNSNKFESMLNAIINNKIFKQKLPGNAFVVGSEAGITEMQTQEEHVSGPLTRFGLATLKVGDTLRYLATDEEASSDIEITKIANGNVYYKDLETGEEDHAQDSWWEKQTNFRKVTTNFNIKNNIIHLGDYKGGKLKGTEVLAPSKIKLKGKLVDLFEKDKKGEYKYIKEIKGGGFEINEDKIDPKLLENFTFRTPTSSHGSGSTIKIVGFIPAAMGDLMITPKNFVTQMGQDFDIDKLTAYQYHHLLNSEGKIVKLDESFKEQALKKLQDDLTELSRQGSIAGNTGIAVAFLDEAIVNAKYGLTEQELTDVILSEDAEVEAKIQKASNAFDMKMAQNRFIEIHNEIYSNPSADIQRRINKVLSMDVAMDQAGAIDDVKSAGSAVKTNILSPNYQMKKLVSGSTGGSAIGVYAKGVTFNSLVQQSKTPFGLVNKGGAEKIIRIGNLVSNGQFGLTNTISRIGANDLEKSLARSTTQVMDEKVNTGTDNEKAQILGRVGITHLNSVAVDNLLSLLGVDLEITQISRYEYEAKGGKGNKFLRKELIDGDEKFFVQYSIPYLLHSQPIIQEYFTRLKNAKSITTDSVANAEEAIFDELVAGMNKEQDINKALTGEAMAGSLNGDYTSDSQKGILTLYKGLIKDAKAVKELNQIVDMSNLGKSMWELKDKIELFEELKDPDGRFADVFDNPLALMGEMVGDNFVPTTNQGKMVSTALNLGRNLFYDLYPYYDQYVEKIVNTIESNANYFTSKPAMQEIIFQEIKKYITSNPADGVFTVDAKQVRDKIFFNKDGNVSLSNYLGNLTSKHPVIRDNVFLGALSLSVGSGGSPDLIKFDNTEGANITDEDFHLAFKELIASDIALPDRHGKPYSTRKLAQELVAYSHASGGIISEVVQFHKYIPIEYYEDLVAKRILPSGVEQRAKSIKMMQRYDTKLNDWGRSDMLKNFETQFIQNNPGYSHILTKGEINDRATIDADRLHLKEVEGEEYKKYVSIKNPGETLKSEQWSLYKLIDNGYYQEIPVVGEFGMSEYDTTKAISTTSVEAPKKEKLVIPTEKSSLSKGEVKPTKLEIKETDTTLDVLKKIVLVNASTNPSVSLMAQNMIELFKDKMLTTKIKVINDPNAGIGGQYTKNTLTINLAVADQSEVFLHEFIHSVTSDHINAYINPDGSLKPNAPTEVKELNTVHKEFRQELQRKFPEEAVEFARKWKIYRTTKDPVSFSEREKSLFYAAVNMKEFLAISLSNNEEFLKGTAQMKYKGSATLSIGQKFAKVFQRIINTIAGKENTVGKDLINHTLGFVEKRANATKNIPQEIDNAELQRLKALYGDEVDFLPASKKETISEVIGDAKNKVMSIFKKQGLTTVDGVFTFDKGNYKENYNALIEAIHELKRYNINNFGVKYTNDWYKTRKVGDKIQVQLQFPIELQNELIKHNGVLPQSFEQEAYVDYSIMGEEGVDFTTEHYVKDKQNFLAQVYKRIGVLKQVHKKTKEQLTQLKKLEKIRTQLHRDLEFLINESVGSDSNEIVPVFSKTFTSLNRDLDVIEKEFLTETPLLENLLIGRDYLNKLKKIHSATGEKRFAQQYYMDMEESVEKDKFIAFHKRLSELEQRMDLAEDKYVAENMTQDDTRVYQEGEDLTKRGKAMDNAMGNIEYLFLPIDSSSDATPMHKFVKKTFDDGMSKRETAGMSRRLQNIQTKVEARLKELGKIKNTRFFSKTISEVDFGLFFKVDGNGSSRLVNKYSNAWNTLKLDSDRNIFRAGKEKFIDNKDQINKDNFETLKEEKVFFIDTTKLTETNPGADIATAIAYKEEVITQIQSDDSPNARKTAEKIYNKLVNEQVEKMNEFESDADSLLRELVATFNLKLEGTETDAEILAMLSESDQKKYNDFVEANSPLRFSEVYEATGDSMMEVSRVNKSSGEVTADKSPATLRYTSFIPTQDKHMSKSFQKNIEGDDVLYEAWNELSEAISWINTNRKYEDISNNKTFNEDQQYDDSLTYEYERTKGTILSLAGLGKYLGENVMEWFKNVISTSRFTDTSKDMRIKGEIKSIDEVIKTEMKDMAKVVTLAGINLNVPIEYKMFPSNVIAYLEERNGGELPFHGTPSELLKHIARKKVMSNQKVNLFDSVTSQLASVEAFKNKKEVENELLFAKNMFDKLNKSVDAKEKRSLSKQIESFVEYQLYGVNNRANWNGLKRGDVGKRIISLQNKELNEATKKSIELLTEIKNNVPNENLEEYEKVSKIIDIENAIKELTSYNDGGGRVLTAGSIMEALTLKLGIVAGLGWNLKSQIHNVLIGNTAGMQSEGLEYSYGNFYKARSYTRKWRKLLPKSKGQRALTDTLLNDLGIFQNSANEINNIREEKIGEKAQNYLNPMFLVGEVEKTIQRPQILAKLADIKIHKYDENGVIKEGESVPVFDINNLDNPHPAFELDDQGVLQLKEEFRDLTGLNQSTWIDKVSQDKDFKEDSVDKNGNIVSQSYAGLFGESGVLPSMIAKMNGDYRNSSTTGIKDTSFGALTMMFKTWMPAYIMRRFHPDYGVHRKLAENGKYTELSTSVISSKFASVFGNASLFGAPLAGVTLAVGAYGTYKFYKGMGKDVKGIKTIIKEIDTWKTLTKVGRTLGAGGAKATQMALRSLNTAGSGEYISDETINNILGMKQGKLSNEEFQIDQARMHFLLTELGASINTLALKAMAQMLYHLATDDDDEESKIAQGIYFSVENLLARYLDEVNLSVNPGEIVEVILSGNTSLNDKFIDVLDATADTIEGKGTFQTGINKGENKILNKVSKILLPKGIQEVLDGNLPSFGFKSSATRDYNPNDFINSFAFSDKKELSNSRKKMVATAKKIKEAELRDENPGWSDEDIDLEVKRYIRNWFPAISEKDFNSKGKLDVYVDETKYNLYRKNK